ncbi:MAG: hypothetical protein JXC32_10090 [Anaerolineae bacterium]|nr:hypothetical protein [Anaerolineae bacterium]
MKVLGMAGGVLLTLLAVALVGLRIRPRPFARYEPRSGEVKTVPLQEGLPAPVARFYRMLYGDAVPVVESAVITGRGPLRIRGISFPGRFRFVHLAGEGYRHYIQATFFGLPVLTVNERYLSGTSFFETPFGVIDNTPKVNQGANLGLWGETIWYPAALMTESGVRWEPVDTTTAVLVVPFAGGGPGPFGEQDQRFIARFDPVTGLLRFLESMRYKGEQAEDKTLWINEALSWSEVDGHRLPLVGAVTWFDEGTPWAVFTVEDIVLNVDVSEAIRAAGP